MANGKEFFTLIGLDNLSADLLATIIKKPKLTIDKYTSELKISKTELNRILNKLESKNIIEITEEKTIRIVPDFALQSAGNLEVMMKDFTEKLKAIRFLSVERFVGEIQRIFESENFRIKKVERKVRRAFHTGEELIDFSFGFEFTAEKFYRFGIFIFDKDNLNKLKKRREFLTRYFFHIFEDLQMEQNCIGTFMFFDPRVHQNEVTFIRKILLSAIKNFPYRLGEFFYIHEPEQNIGEFISNKLSEINNRREIIEKHFDELRQELRSTRDLIVEDSMMISQLNSLTAGQYLSHRFKKEELKRLMKPIKNVVDRESRNLGIFERKFEEERAAIERHLDSFDKRLSLPNPVDIKQKISNIVKLKSKFEPIRHELKSLLDLLLFPYVEGKQPMKINPFILTEPNDIEKFTVNQNKIKQASIDFFKKFTIGGSNILFLVGAAGTGKTHSLKHIFYNNAKKMKIWPIYIDCSMKYDLISSLFNEIAQERHFPKEVHDYLPSLRRQRVLSEFEFIEIINNINKMMRSNGYNSIVLLIDELENSLPYTYHARFQDELSSKEEAPLALRQLREVISSDRVREVGFIFSLRNHILPELKKWIKLKNFNDYVIKPEFFNIDDFKELIENRYSIWNTKKITFQTKIIKEIMKRTNSNTRHSIQYFRALFNYALSENRKIITQKTLNKIGRLPLFSY